MVFSSEVQKSIEVNVATFKLRHPELVFDEDRIRKHSFAFPLHCLKAMETLGKVRHPNATPIHAKPGLMRRLRGLIHRIAYVAIRPFLAQQQEFNNLAATLAQTVIHLERRILELERQSSLSAKADR